MTMDSETPNAYPPKQLRSASSRRLMAGAAFMAGALAVGGAVYADGANKQPPLPQASAVRQNGIDKPGFADLVAQVKPAVVSVRVKIDAGPEDDAADGDQTDAVRGCAL